MTEKSRTDWIGAAVPIVLSVLLTFVLLAPLAYKAWRAMPPRVVTIDLQALVEEDQKRMLDVIGKDGNVTDEQRSAATKLAGDFAKKLSITVDELGQECGCVIVNKAALLGGVAIDYTDVVRARMKR
ncbi:hypothetical protein WS86_00120 (plasmid) [Burkholderia savannae]|uniref:Type-F conjugative transfer system protein TrbI n=1 Tax=Burkholderia savannae TaxID=1637837 RepID=A0ABR5T8I1_9BURK|nr:hypothetical protein WS86_00120 [Burkholderia savannae]KWZ39596.1 hypothetical protein WS72_19445 [Burkholderia savannae]